MEAISHSGRAKERQGHHIIHYIELELDVHRVSANSTDTMDTAIGMTQAPTYPLPLSRHSSPRISQSAAWYPPGPPAGITLSKFSRSILPFSKYDCPDLHCEGRQVGEKPRFPGSEEFG